MQTKEIIYKSREPSTLSSRTHSLSLDAIRIKPADYQRVATSVTFCRSVLVDLKAWRSLHCIEHLPCFPNPELLPAEGCRAVHYGVCSPLVKPLVPLHKKSSKKQKKPLARCLEATSQVQAQNNHERSPSPDYCHIDDASLSNRSSFTSQPDSQAASGSCSDSECDKATATITTAGPRKQATPAPKSAPSNGVAVNNNVNAINGSIANNHPQKVAKCATKVAPSPLVTDSASTAIELLADDAEGRLESLLKTFVSEEKQRQEAKLNFHLLNNSKRSSSLSALNVNNKSATSGSPLYSPSSPTSPSSPQYSPTDFYIRGRSSHSHKNRSPSPSRNIANSALAAAIALSTPVAIAAAAPSSSSSPTASSGNISSKSGVSPVLVARSDAKQTKKKQDTSCAPISSPSPSATVASPAAPSSPQLTAPSAPPPLVQTGSKSAGLSSSSFTTEPANKAQTEPSVANAKTAESKETPLSASNSTAKRIDETPKKAKSSTAKSSHSIVQSKAKHFLEKSQQANSTPNQLNSSGNKMVFGQTPKSGSKFAQIASERDSVAGLLITPSFGIINNNNVNGSNKEKANKENNKKTSSSDGKTKKENKSPGKNGSVSVPNNKSAEVIEASQTPATLVTTSNNQASNQGNKAQPAKQAVSPTSELKTGSGRSASPSPSGGSATANPAGNSNPVANASEKSMEQLLTEALQLTDDEKASLLASQQKKSLVQKLQQQRQQDHLSNPTNNPQPNQLDANRKAFSEKASQQAAQALPANPSDINYQSAVDYAKTRFINNSSTPVRSSSPVDNKTPTQTLVSEAKSKWEVPNPAAVPGPSPSPATGQAVPYQEDQHPAHRANQQKLNGQAPADGRSPVKPFLSKGSVAERVMLFEKCPELRSHRPGHNRDRRAKSPVLYGHWKNQDKNQNDVAHLARNYDSSGTNGIASSTNNQHPPHPGGFQRKSSFRASWGAACLEIPRFYYPNGRPYTSLEIETQIRRIRSEFEKLPGKQATRFEMARIVKVCGVPLYWKEPLFLAVTANLSTSSPTTVNTNKLGSTVNLNTIGVNPRNGKVVPCEDFIDYWKRLLSTSYDETSRFVKILTKGARNYLEHEDFIPMIQDVVDSHPGLSFLKDAIEFHSRYVHTVIARIFYCVNKSWSGRILIPELRKSNFLAVLSILDEEEDINQITDYFSYEHFYVIYCKFWELDKDHDLVIDKYDLSKHNDGGAVTRGPVRKHGVMTYTEFVWFLVSEEDKRHPRSIEYWFRCMDLDGDGYLSMYELEYFYEEQVRRMEAIGIEALPFNDCLCQMLDMVRPQIPDKVSLADLKRCRMTAVFFDTFMNLDKYLDHEQRDPFASNKNEDDMPMSDWERFAAEEYELLVAEESTSMNSAQNAEIIAFEKEPHVIKGSGALVNHGPINATGSVPDYVIATKKFGLKPRKYDDDDDDYAEPYADV